MGPNILCTENSWWTHILSLALQILRITFTYPEDEVIRYRSSKQHLSFGKWTQFQQLRQIKITGIWRYKWWALRRQVNHTHLNFTLPIFIKILRIKSAKGSTLNISQCFQFDYFIIPQYLGYKSLILTLWKIQYRSE